MDPEKPDLDAALRELAAEERRRLGGEHPDPEVLLAYQQEDLPEAEAERIRDHLALCRECGELVLDFAAFPGLEPPAGGPRVDRREIRERWRELQAAMGGARMPAWRRSAVVLPLAAAFLVAALGLGAWNVSLRERLTEATAPRGIVPVFDVSPESRVTRGTSRNTLQLPATADRVVVSLLVGEPRDFPAYEVDLTDAGGRRLVAGLEVRRAPPPGEGFSPELPGAAAGAGRVPDRPLRRPRRRPRAAGTLPVRSGSFRSMTRRRHRRSLAAHLAPLALAWALPGCSPAPPAPAAPARPAASPAAAPRPAASRGAREAVLEPGGTFGGPLAPGACDRYRVALEAGRVLDLAVDQRGADVAITVTPPAGAGPPVELDSPVQDRGPDGGLLVAAATGEHEVTVCLGAGSAPGGAYSLRVAPARPASPEDRLRDGATRSYARGRVLAAAGRAEEAHRAFEAAAAGWHRTGEAAREGWARYKLADLAREGDDFDRAKAEYCAAAALAGAAGDEWMQTRCVEWQAWAARRAGRVHESLDLYLESARLARAAGAGELEARALGNAAQIHAETGDALEALRLWRRVEAFDRAAGRWGEALASLDWQAWIFAEAGDWGQVLGRVGERRRLAHAHGLRRDEAKALAELGAIHLETGRSRLAVQYLERARASFEALGDARGVGAVLDDLGRARRALGDLDGAMRTFDHSRELLETRGSGEMIGRLHLDVARLLEDRGDPARGVEECRAALARFERGGATVLVARAWNCLAHHQRLAGDLDAALESISRAIALVETERSRSAPRNLRTALLASRHDYYELEVEILMAQAKRHPDGDFVRRALEAAERSKARTLLDRLAQQAAGLERSADPALVARVDQLAAGIEEIERQLFAGGAAGGSAGGGEGALRRRLTELRRERDLARGAVLAAHPGWRRLLEPAPTGLADLRRELLSDGRTELLDYFLGERESWVWLVGRETLVARQLPGRARIEDLADRASALLGRSGEAHSRLQAQLAAESLARAVLAPVAGRITAERLAVAADGALHSVPFCALPVPAAGTARVLLGKRHEIVEIPSVSSAVRLGALRERRGTSSRRLVIVADPVVSASDERLRGRVRPAALAGREAPSTAAFEATQAASAGDFARYFPRLEAAGEEAESIAELVPPGARRVVVGFDASRRFVLDGGLRGFGIVHFATHGLAGPGLSGLLLSRWDSRGRPADGLLTEQEIYDLDLDADLVVLGTCRSGLGTRVPGEGVLGLARAFLYAGASQVLVSLWDVDDEATARFMELFYRALLRTGDAPGRALQAAQGALRADPRWSAPQYWAGFALQGADLPPS